MICTVRLNKHLWERPRRALTRPVEQVIQQRAAVVAQYADSDEAWRRWADGGLRLLIQVSFLDHVRPVSLKVDPRMWILNVSLDVGDYDGLRPGPEAGLRFIRTVEEVLTGIPPKVATPPPHHLGRSRRELDWLAQGGKEPTPSDFGPWRVHRPPGPMPEEEFWSLMQRTVDEHSGAFRLGWQRADRFTARMRALIEPLDDEPHRAVAERAMGFVSDDVWDDVRAWVVSKGREVYLAVVDRPETLAAMLQAMDTEDELATGEALLYLQGRD